MGEAFELQTMNGPIPAVFEMPDMLALVGGGLEIPNAAAADVLRLISGRLEPHLSDPAAEFLADKQYTRGLYELVALCVAEPPIFIPRVKDDPTPAGSISYRDLPWVEVLAIYNRFRFGFPLPVSAAEDNQPDVGAATAPDGDDLPQSAE
jgi:hypothetical protein